MEPVTDTAAVGTRTALRSNNEVMQDENIPSTISGVTLSGADSRPVAGFGGAASGVVDRVGLPVGTRIRFTRTLSEGPSEEHPGRLYATKGEMGWVTGHGAREGYWVKTDSWPAWFGASSQEIEAI